MGAFVISGYSKSSSVEPDIFTKCWEYKAAPNLDAGLAADGTSVYFLDVENRLHAVDIAVADNSWTSELGGAVVSNLLVLQGSVFVVTRSQPDASNASSKTTLRALSRETGITEWAAEIPTSPVVWIGSVAGNIVAVSSDGSAWALASSDGKSVWKSDLASRVAAAPVFYENGIEIATSKNEVLEVSGNDGRVRVEWKSLYLPTAILVDTNSRLVVGDERGNIVAVSSDGDRLWSFKNGAQISSASLHTNEYLAASFDNFVYKISRSGNVRWKRRLSGRVSDRPLVLDDSAVISIIGAGSVYVLDLKKGKVSNRIDMGDEMTLRVAVAGSGFVIASPAAISYFTIGKCPVK